MYNELSVIFTMKIEFDESFEILSRNRKQLHQRRTVSSVLDLSNTSLHNKSFSSQLPSMSDELQTEIQKIKQEVKQRCREQRERDLVFQSMLSPEYVLQTDDIQIEPIQNKFSLGSPKRPQSGIFLFCKACFWRCFNYKFNVK